MMQIDYRSTPLIDIQRAEIAGMVDAFLATGGQITVIPGIEQRLDQPYQWNRNDLILPGSSAATPEQNRVAAAVRRIRELVEKGAGITAMKMDLRMDVDRIKRLAAEHGITIKHATTQKRELGQAARKAQVDAGKLRRSKLAPVIAKLAGEGLTIAEMAERAGCSRRTVFRVIDEYQIQRVRHE